MNDLGFITEEKTDLGFEENKNLMTIPSPYTPPELASPGLWNARMAFDVALGAEEEETIRQRYDLTEREFNYILAQPMFRAEVGAHVSAFKEHGVTFVIKAKLIAEEKLADMYYIISDLSLDPRIRVDAWKSVVKAAGLELSGDRAGVTANANNVQIVINY
mgnify:CR=1 FL=1